MTSLGKCPSALAPNLKYCCSWGAYTVVTQHAAAFTLETDRKHLQQHAERVTLVLMWQYAGLRTMVLIRRHAVRNTEMLILCKQMLLEEAC